MGWELLHKPEVTGAGFATVKDDRADTGRRGQWTVDGQSCVRTYTVRLKVEMSDHTVGPIAILRSLPAQFGDHYQYPLVGTTTETDEGSFLQSVSLDEFSVDGKQCIATLEYAPFDVVHELGNSQISNGVIDPTDRKPLVEWSDAKYKRSKVEDYSTPDPKPFLNTIGDPLLDPPEIEETRPVLTFTRNETHYNEAYASTYKDTVNAGDFLGYPRNTVKCKNIRGTRKFDSDWGYFWEVQYQFEFRDDDDDNGFTELIINAGYRQKVSGAGNPVQITIAGKDITDAVGLQEDGSYQPGVDPYFIDFKLFPEVDFDQLNIPQDILDANQ